MKVGVFDSGIGGKLIATTIQKALPSAQIVYLQDKKNLPYGSKTKKQLEALITPFIKEFNRENCDAVVIACNTATTNCIEYIRSISSAPIIGIEPMVKPAAMQTKSNIIAVCATPTTLKSSRYKSLKYNFASGIKVLEPDCGQWSTMIEGNNMNRANLENQIRELCLAGADVIVLGCTHYHWIEEEIAAIASEFRVKVIQPEEAIVRRLKQVLSLQP